MESIIFYLLLIDALGANLFAFSGGKKWYQRNCTILARYFPLSKGWTLYYLTLVLFIGYILLRHNLLVTFW